jgi:hypothetical protein
MKSILEGLALLRYAQAQTCAKYCLWKIERESIALAKAFASLDRARADLRALEVEGNSEPEIPKYLQEKK